MLVLRLTFFVAIVSCYEVLNSTQAVSNKLTQIFGLFSLPQQTQDCNSTVCSVDSIITTVEESIQNPNRLLNIADPEVISENAESETIDAYAQTVHYIRERLNTTIDPCTDFYNYACSSNTTESVFQTTDLQVRQLMMKAMRNPKLNSLTSKAQLYLQRCYEYFHRPNHTEAVGEMRFLLSKLPNWRLSAVAHSVTNLPQLTSENIARTFAVLYRYVGVNFGLHVHFYNQPQPLIVFEVDPIAANDQLTDFQATMRIASSAFGDPLDWSGLTEVVLRAHKLLWSRMERKNGHLTSSAYDLHWPAIDQAYPNFHLSTFLKVLTDGHFELSSLLKPGTIIRLPSAFFLGLNVLIADAKMSRLQTLAFVSLINFRMFETMFRGPQADVRFDEADRFERGERATSRKTSGGTVDCVFDSRGLSSLMTRLLVDSYFPSQKAREHHENVTARMLGIIRNNLRSMLHEIEWLDESARVGLIQKLDAFNYVVGYDMNLYNDTLIQQLANQIDILADDSFPKLRRKTVEAELKFESMRVRGQLQIRGKELEPDFVFMINAFYEPTTHTVNIPMGYQLDPFFNANYPRSVRYGRFGWSIGHELSHAFDPVNLNYDENYNQRHLLLNVPRQHYTRSIQCLINEYNRFERNGLKSNGHETANENVADITGIRIAYRAFKDFQDISGSEPRLNDPLLRHLTPEQLFFIGGAQKYCAQIDFTDHIHPNGWTRVLGSFRNFAPFADAFNCPRSIYNPESRCEVWFSLPKKVQRLGDP